MHKAVMLCRMHGQLFRLLWRSHRIATLTQWITPWIKGIIPLLNVVIFSKIVESITTQLMQRNDTDSIYLQPVMNWLLLLGGVIILGNLWTTVSAMMEERLRKAAIAVVDKECLEVTKDLPLMYMEDPQFHNLATRALGAGSDGLIRHFTMLIGTSRIIISAGSLIIYISTISWLLSASIILITIPYLKFQMKCTIRMNELLNRQTEESRKADYASSLLADRSIVKEIRLFSLENTLIKIWRNFIKKADNELLNEESSQTKRMSLWEIMITTLFVFCQGGVLILFSMGKVNAGLTVALFIAFQQIQHLILGLSGSVYGLMMSYYELEKYSEFMKYKQYIPVHDENKPRLRPLQEEIVCKDLCFKYPGQERLALASINLHIHAGETIALIGENGSGKTTLAKLLLGLYEPTSGSIAFDSVDIKSIHKPSLHQQTSAVFQDYGKYELSMRENMALGSLEHVNHDELLINAAREAGLTDLIQQLPQGLDTRLGGRFNHSVDLSGGQWQKVALSRSLVKDISLLVLDEPTSNLDPVSEMQVLKQFMQSAQSQTTLLISHRIGCARLADKIIVLDHGRVVEMGKHEQLIQHNGKYSELFHLQSKWYTQHA